MGDKNHKRIELHHSQVNTAKSKKKELNQQRHYIFEINRANIKIKIETERQFLVTSALVFLIGLILVFFGLSYVVGAILYG